MWVRRLREVQPSCRLNRAKADRHFPCLFVCRSWMGCSRVVCQPFLEYGPTMVIVATTTEIKLALIAYEDWPMLVRRDFGVFNSSFISECSSSLLVCKFARRKHEVVHVLSLKSSWSFPCMINAQTVMDDNCLTLTWASYCPGILRQKLS